MGGGEGGGRGVGRWERVGGSHVMSGANLAELEMYPRIVLSHSLTVRAQGTRQPLVSTCMSEARACTR